MDRRERQMGGRHPPEHGAEHDGYAPSHNIFDSDSYDAPVEKKYQEVSLMKIQMNLLQNQVSFKMQNK